MADVVRAALVQAQWAGDKDTMTKNAVRSVQQAAAAGAKVVCLQELFNGPYFCQVQDGSWYDFAEPVPDGPTVRQFMDLAREHGGRARGPALRGRAPRCVLQHRRGHRRGRAVSRQAPQEPHPAGLGLLGEVLFPARATSATRCSTPPSAASASTSATSVTSPKAGGPWGSQARRSSSTLRRRAVDCRSTCGGWNSRRPRWRTSTSWGRSTASVPSRSARTSSTASRTSSTPVGSSWARSPPTSTEAVIVRDLDLTMIDEVRRLWAFYRDRRPETYDSLCEA